MPPTLLVPMESIFTKIDSLSNSTVASGQNVALAIAVVVLLITAVACRLKASTMIITFIFCGFFVWGVHNMDVGKKTVGDTLNNQPAAGANQNP